jgi:hypothetical protein
MLKFLQLFPEDDSNVVAIESRLCEAQVSLWQTSITANKRLNFWSHRLITLNFYRRRMFPLE